MNSIRIALATLLLVPALSCPAVSGVIEQPSIGTAKATILLANRTSAEVVFYLLTRGTVRTEHRLAANSSATFEGVAGDTFFNIEVSSNTPRGKVTRTYGIPIGERNYFEWKDDVLDVFKMPPTGGR